MAGDEEVDIPETGAVFTFGRSRFADNVPSHFFIRNDPVVELACGDEHTALVCKKGRVFMFGNNDYGQLGLGHRNVMTKPSCVKTLKPERTIHVACGRAHTLATAESGKLFTWGSNSDGQLGVGDMQDRVVPTQVLDYEGDNIKQLSAGCHHSAALTESGHIYIWGSNSDGQLGLKDDQDNVLTPKLLPFSHPVSHISCGYYHTAFVTEDGDLYTCGEGESGKLGLPNSVVNCTTPTQVILGTSVIAVACGGNHTIALTEDGKVFAFGNNLSGQLGLGTDLSQSILPTVVQSLNEHTVVEVNCGENHTTFITDKGQLYICGEGRYGKLCNDDIDTTKQSLPIRVTKFKSYFVERVGCGGCHTMVLAHLRAGIDEEIENVTIPYALENVDNLLGLRTLPPLLSPTSLNNNMDLDEDEDKMSTTVEHHSSHSKDELMGSTESIDVNGNGEIEDELEDKGDISDGTEHLEDPSEREHEIQNLEEIEEDGEKDNDDVKVESEAKKESRMSRFFSAFRRKKPTSAQSTRTMSAKDEEGTAPVERQRSTSLGEARLEEEVGSGDAKEDTKSKRGDSGKSKHSVAGNHKKSKACTVL